MHSLESTQSLIWTGYTVIESSLSQCALKVTKECRNRYRYFGQKLIDFSDYRLCEQIAKLVHQFVTTVPLIAFLMAVPIKLTSLSCIIYTLSYDIECNDATVSKILSAISCVLFLKSAFNLATFKDSFSLTLALLQFSAAASCSFCLNLLEMDR